VDNVVKKQLFYLLVNVGKIASNYMFRPLQWSSSGGKYPYNMQSIFCLILCILYGYFSR